MEDWIRFDNVINVMGQYGNDVVNTYRQSLEDNDKKASGNLISSIGYDIQIDGNHLRCELNMADYYYYVENGRKAGKFPPPDKILEWIQVKPVKPYEKNGRIPTEKQLAYLIGKKISEEGIKPSPILEATLNILNEKYMPLFHEAVQKDIGDMAGNLLSILQFRK